MYDEKMLNSLGLTIGREVQGGEVLELVGDVGAGKTTLTKAIARGMGISGPVQSPTFTISNRYDGADGRILAHYDFYRLNDGGVMADELAETIHDPKVVTVIEWGEIIQNVLPEDRLTVEFQTVDENTRSLALKSRGPKSDKIKEKIQ